MGVETSLRARVRAGDPDAFRELFDRHHRSVYNHAFRLIGDWSAAEDTVSVTFLEAWRLRDRVDVDGGSLRPWLLGIATNVVRNTRRAARRYDGALARLPPLGVERGPVRSGEFPMNTEPIQPDSSELARLVPAPVERDLPSGRRRHLEEFVMSRIHQDLRADEEKPRRAPRRRRAAVLSAGVAGIAAVATAAAVFGAGVPGRPGSRPATSAVSTPSGLQVLLMAAATAERAPEGSGTYWYVKTVTGGEKGKPFQTERWTRRDGREWFRGEKSGGRVIEWPEPGGLYLGARKVSFQQLADLPTAPDKLKAWIVDAVAKGSANGEIRTSAGRPSAADERQFLLDGLISLVSGLPAPPKVRAAAFRTLASEPGVKSLGAVKGGQGLSTPAGRLVVDPATSQVRETSVFVPPDGGRYYAPDGASIVAEWTNTLPK